jgi:hypothetical protein
MGVLFTAPALQSDHLRTRRFGIIKENKMGESKTTTNHGEIQKWVEERGGQPSRVKGTESKSSVGLLRIDYPGFTGEETLEEITWNEFFEAFDRERLAFLYQEETKDGKLSRFSKLVNRGAAAGAEAKSAGRSR